MTRVSEFACSGYDLKDTDGNSVNGVADLESICDPLSTALIKDRGILYQTSSTTAHELGHTFGLDHDNDISKHYLN